MNISIFLAKAFGLYLIIISASMMLNVKRMKSIIADYFASPALLLLGGAIALILGILLILTHNIWKLDWRLIITLLAWLTFIKGFMYVVFPLQTSKMMAKFTQVMRNPIRYNIIFAIYFLVGAVLCYVGFFLKATSN